jgi:hypothetical protein
MLLRLMRNESQGRNIVRTESLILRSTVIIIIFSSIFSVVSYQDVLRELRGDIVGVGRAGGDGAESDSADLRSSYYPTTGSPTWSSRR